MPVHVLLVDDSAVIRGLMAKALAADPNINVVATAADGAMAITLATAKKPDVIILDIEMPGMDGITALPELLKVAPETKIIMASTLTLRNAAISMQALTLGASDYMPKPTAKIGGDADVFFAELIEKIKALGGPAARGRGETIRTVRASHPAEAAGFVLPPPPVAPQAAPEPAKPKPFVQPPDASTPLHVGGVKALAIASSTGGPQALLALFEQLKGHLLNLPIFITQHMPPTFTTILADHIAKVSGRTCEEGKEGQVVVPGNIYLAPGDWHMVPESRNGTIVISVNQGPQENYCRPAADPMLRSLSTLYGKHLAVVVLTGMGQDGMLGCKDVVAGGGSVVAQDEASCVVYGMPKAVVEKGLARAVLPLSGIGRYLIQQIEGRG